MFGYLRVEKSELLVKEYEQYKAVYCSLCKQLGKEYSVLSRFILSYDCTLFAVFAMSQKKQCCGFTQGRCRFNPLKQCNYCVNGEAELKKAAAISVITAYYKVVDDIHDSHFLKRLLYKAVRPVFGRWRKKAAAAYPDYDAVVKNMMAQQQECEVDPDCCPDQAAQPTAHMMAALFQSQAKSPQEEIVLNQLGYHLGRWVYLIDAADDLEKDSKHNNFNPFIKKYKEDPDGLRIYCNQVLNQCLYQVYSAYELLQVTHLEGILRNVFLFGLHSEQDRVLNKKWKIKEGIENEKSL